MSKQQLFLRSENQTKIIKHIYSRYRSESGVGLTLDDISNIIKTKVQDWPQLSHLDSYESLRWDPVVEIEKINQDFIKWIWPSIYPYEMDVARKPVDNTNWGVEDYRNMDIARPNEGEETIVDNSQYRYDNTFPLYQRQPERHYDHEGSGLRGRALDTSDSRSKYYNTNDVLAIANKPYRQNDTNDWPYYGQPNDDSSTLLLNTMWISRNDQ
jgi:hypothetical protein